MTVVNEICELLQVHANRDKVVSLTCYALKLCGSSGNRPSLMKASAGLASTRATLRLYDDAAVLKAVYSYGLGKQDGPFWGTLGVSNGLFTLAYLQAEKLMWLADTGCLSLDEKTVYRVKVAHKLFWSLYTFVGLIRSLRALHIAAQNLNQAKRTKCAPRRFQYATLTTTKLLLDFIHAVTWLPRGWLWGGAVRTSHAAALATAAAALGIVLHFEGKKLQQR
ncbi:peroxisomal membrane protein 11C-like [Aricia agestis]|uniref:peroxisomal membrane protein 11C-like n=1 Tax=Aricia agestis TaxID=91739 RepID=UPI001C2027FB|nr:peroxisomal membrane protein 11C-like [Aricia agestis]